MSWDAAAAAVVDEVEDESNLAMIPLVTDAP